VTAVTAVHAVVTGGGTSGHVLPALAIADALVAHGHRVDEIHYVGTQRGIERALVPRTGYPHTLLDVVGLQRSLSGRSLLRNIAFGPKMVRSIWQAHRLLGRLRPAVVVNVGGYGSFPASAAARLRRIPIVVVSYDRRPGLVSRLMARVASATAVAFADTDLPRAVHTGAPVRRSIVAIDRDVDRDVARQALGWPADRFVVAVLCGSLGARDVNGVVADVVERFADRRDLAVHHVVGERFLAEAPAERDGGDGIWYRVVGYEDRMPQVYAAADLMVTRAGASTIAELATAGVPALVVPWPGAADDHQTDNARALGDVGAAVVVAQADLSADRLAAEIEDVRTHPQRLTALAAAAREAGAVHRSDALVELVERVAAGGRRGPSS
jgi:UDP-N-acetylglucosamine--N-acetylmuramyl-(pentapeptide) pyrophosphoryl-undecaprenol N-acetylglucosamine transferase